jgi:hypothetical protein
LHIDDLSALILLYDHCTIVGITSKVSPEDKELQELGSSGLDALVAEVVDYASHIQTVISFYLDHASPLVTHCLYHTAKRLIGAASPDSLRAFTFIKETLQKLSLRWMVAGERSVEIFGSLTK